MSCRTPSHFLLKCVEKLQSENTYKAAISGHESMCIIYIHTQLHRKIEVSKSQTKD